MRSCRIHSWAIALSWLLLAAPAAAEPQAPVQSLRGSDDAVLLKDGTLFRGTIMELVPGRSVRIVLTTGETRVIPMDSVSYAGAGSALASASAPPGSQVELRANKSGVTYFWRGDSARLTIDGTGHTLQTYRRVCTAPCELLLPPGTYQMALASGSGDPVAVEEPVVIEGPSTLRAKHTSYAPLRVAGAILGVGAAIGGIYLMGTGLLRSKDTCDAAGNCSTEPDVDTQKVLIGAGVLVVGAVVGGLLQGKSDGAEIMVSPLVVPTRSRVPGASLPGHDALSTSPWLTPGLTVSAIF